MSDRDINELRDRVTEAALFIAPFDGWSKKTLTDAVLECGLEKEDAEALFPKGSLDVLVWLSGMADRKMIALSPQNKLAALSPAEKIALLLRNRLEPWSNHKEALRRATAYLSLPPYAPTGLQLVWDTINSLFAHLPPDIQRELPPFTGKPGIFAVYIALIPYWLGDQSDDDADSWDFLSRRTEALFDLAGKGKILEDKFSLRKKILKHALAGGRRHRKR